MRNLTTFSRPRWPWKGAVSAALLAAVSVSCATGMKEDPVPSYLRVYEELYAKNPRKAAVQWFQDAKFGLFVHYALASVLDRGKPEFLKLPGDDEVTALIERFDAKNFDAGKICDLALAAGMRYVTFTTKHLGGLYMYRTKATKFNSLNSPARRDLVAELAEACQRRGLGLFLYVPPETARTSETYFEQNRAILGELLSQYGPIAGIWFDGIGDYYRSPENYSRLSETYSFVRSLQPQCLISFKDGAIGEEDFRSPEHFLLPAPVEWSSKLRQERWEERLRSWQRRHPEDRLKLFRDMPAEINTTMQECFNRDGVGERGGWINDSEARHLSADEVMELLEKARSLDANLLLNIGPTADGSVHPGDVKALTEVGRRIRATGFPGESRPARPGGGRKSP